MFTISAKAAYGIYAMLELTKHYQIGSIQIKDIAEAQKIPQHYLEQLLVTLRKAGLVKSFRGTNGGYALAEHPARIIVAHIFTALEGPIAVLREQVPRGGIDFFWDKLENKLKTIMDCSLEELYNQKQENQNNFIYTI
jgi:Rrf2 family cysteine metabolism transcriptional repressor